jgi:hypothetical protein
MTQTAYLIKEADQGVLHALARFHYLTAAQTIRLLYPNNNDARARYTQKLFKRLVDAGYVLRLRALPMPKYGMAPHVFTLAKKGREYVSGMGVSVEPYFRPSRERDASENSPFMLHRLAAIDVMIAAERLCWDVPEVSCPQMLSERELKRGAVRVEVPPSRQSNSDGPRKVAVIPDAWFQLSINDGPPMSIALELDRATEDQNVWRGKVAAYAVWANGPYQQAFETDNLTIAVVCPHERRRAVLMDWTKRELHARELDEYAELFVFTATSSVDASPARFFFGKVWQQADSTKSISLIEPPDPPSPEKGVVYLHT